MLRSDLVKMVVGYQPSFTSYNGGVYEMGLTVSAIDTFARHISKANPKIKGTAYKNLESQWQVRINDTMTMQQFLYRTATIFKCENNVFIIPIYDQYHFICGLYPVSSLGSKIQTINGTLMLKYQMENKEYAIPYLEVGHLRNHQYKNELYGDNNNAIASTMELLNIQDQGIINGVKQSATIRFLAKLTNIMKPEDMKKERIRIAEDNLNVDNQGGVLIFDNKYSDIKQVDSKPFIVDAEQATYIRTNVYNYFGVNEDVIQNKFNEDSWGAYYEGSLEPFLIQLSQVITSMLFTPKELAYGNYVIFESTRLQHANTTTKLNLITQLFDRGFINHDMGLEILNLPPLPDGKGQKFYIRLEYADVDNLGKVQVGETKGDEENDKQE